MEYEKQKNIRKILINYTNQQLIYNKNKNKNKDFLINSKPLEELEKKNMRSKEFYIVEKPHIFQNINNDRSIIQNTYINHNSIRSSIVIYPLATKIINDKKVKDIENIYNNHLNITYIDDNSKNESEVIFKKSKIPETIKPNESPVARSKLIKKELGERKFKLSKNDIKYNNFSYYSKNKIKKNKKEEENNKKHKNEISLSKGNSRQLSIETLATEISRIIKIVHNEKNINSFGLSQSNRKIEENSDIKKAKIYAKKLKYYCRTLKNKHPRDESIIKLKPLNQMDNSFKKHKIINSNIDNNENNEKNFDKGKKRKSIIYHKVKISYKKKNSKKIQEENKTLDDNLTKIKYPPPYKKLKSEVNIQSKIKINSFICSNENNNNNVQNINNNYKTNDNDSRKEIAINSTFSKNKKKIKIIPKKKEICRLKTKPIKNIIKPPIKIKKKEIIPNILIKKIKNKLEDIKRASKKNKKYQNNNNNNSQKIESPMLDNSSKRASFDIRMLKIGERLDNNFLTLENSSSSDEFSELKRTKKSYFYLNYKTNGDGANEQDNMSPSKKERKLKKKNNQTVIYSHNNNKKLENMRKLLNIQKTKTERNKDNLNLSKHINNKKRKSSSIPKEKVEEIIINNIDTLDTIDGGTQKKKRKKKLQKNNN